MLTAVEEYLAIWFRRTETRQYVVPGFSIPRGLVPRILGLEQGDLKVSCYCYAPRVDDATLGVLCRHLESQAGIALNHIGLGLQSLTFGVWVRERG